MAHMVDVHVGKKLKQLRVLRGLTQTDVAKGLNISFQQVQKYELGRNRISASKLFDVSRILKVPPAYFFEGLEGNIEKMPADDVLADKDVAEVAQAFAALPESLKDPVRELLRNLLRFIERLKAGKVD